MTLAGAHNRDTVPLGSAVSFCELKFLLKKDQIQAVNDYRKGKDVLANLAIGYGKSLCYGLCPLTTENFRGVTRKEQRSILVLISPLKAVMDDQLLSLNQLGLSCLKLTPDISEECMCAGCEVRIFRWPVFHLSLLCVLVGCNNGRG